MCHADGVAEEEGVLEGVLDDVGELEGVREGVGVEEKDTVGVTEGVLDGVAVVEGVLDGVEVEDGVSDTVGVCDGVIDGVRLGEGVPDGVTDTEGVLLGVMLGVRVGVRVWLGVTDADGEGEAPAQANTHREGTKNTLRGAGYALCKLLVTLPSPMTRPPKEDVDIHRRCEDLAYFKNNAGEDNPADSCTADCPIKYRSAKQPLLTPLGLLFKHERYWSLPIDDNTVIRIEPRAANSPQLL